MQERRLEILVVEGPVSPVVNSTMAGGTERNDVVELVRSAVREAARMVRREVPATLLRLERRRRATSFADTAGTPPTITEADIYEFSFVTVPQYEGATARVEDAK